MKRIILAKIIILIFANVALASEKGVYKDTYKFVGDEIATDICAAALKSKASIVAEAKRLHLTRKSLKDVTCNGQSLTDFANANKFILGSKTLASAE